eukprot:COSAG05_NODE_10852_length_542_cov_1.255079_1_plen_128_part_01
MGEMLNLVALPPGLPAAIAGWLPGGRGALVSGSSQWREAWRPSLRAPAASAMEENVAAAAPAKVPADVAAPGLPLQAPTVAALRTAGKLRAGQQQSDEFGRRYSCRGRVSTRRRHGRVTFCDLELLQG